MKRCPQCQFVYEDDQAVCDMDGKELVRESRWFPLPVTAATEPPAPARSRWRSLVLLTIASGVLAGVLYVDYYNLNHGTAPRVVSAKPEMPAAKPETRNPGRGTSTSKPDPDPTATGAPATRNSKRETSETATPTPRKSLEVSVSRRAAATARPTGSRVPVAKPEETKSPASADANPAGTNQKKQSKFRSILKKTGQVLRKPFRL